jgi:hypothetical protein
MAFSIFPTPSVDIPGFDEETLSWIIPEENEDGE